MAVFYTSPCNNLIQYYFEVGGVNLDGTFNFTAPIQTDVLEMNHSGNFQIQIGLFNSDGEVEVTLQQSSDNIMWDDMRNASAKTILQDNSITFEDSFFTGRYIRIKVAPTTLTTGDIKIILTEKA